MKHCHRVRRYLLGAPVLLAGVMFTQACLYHPLGVRFAFGIWPVPQGTPWTYQLLSGFVASMAVASVFASVVTFIRMANCHHPGCWRFGRHRVSGTPWCDTHHEEARPEVPEHELLSGILAELKGLREDLHRGPG